MHSKIHAPTKDSNFFAKVDVNHIATIAQKGHQRANLIHRYFTSKDRNLLVKAFYYTDYILYFILVFWYVRFHRFELHTMSELCFELITRKLSNR